MSFQVGDLVRPADFVVEQRYVVTAVGEQMLIAKADRWNPRVVLARSLRHGAWRPKRYVIEMQPSAGGRIVVQANMGAWTTAPTAVRNVVEAVVVENWREPSRPQPASPNAGRTAQDQCDRCQRLDRGRGTGHLAQGCRMTSATTTGNQRDALEQAVRRFCVTDDGVEA